MQSMQFYKENNNPNNTTPRQPELLFNVFSQFDTCIHRHTYTETKLGSKFLSCFSHIKFCEHFSKSLGIF